VRGQADTVWYGNLMSSERPSVSVRHTGDIRAGQSSGSGSSGNGGAELEDLERIYVDLSSLPKQ
jgi:stress response protein SCP2